jgi:hypothetical protein
MRELEDEIARLELRSQQLLIHLQELPSRSPDALQARKDLEGMAKRLALVKGQRDRLLRDGQSPARTLARTGGAGRIDL